MTEMSEIEASIVNARSSQECEAGLRALLGWLMKHPGERVSPRLEAHLAQFRTEDQVQGALAGLVLRQLHPEGAVPLGILARVFPMLDNVWEPDLQSLAIALFHDRSPREVYREISEAVGLDQGSELDMFYGYAVLSRVDHTSLRDAAASYRV